ncbi:DUF1616 domain-containing protein [Halorubrum lipolyticum]|uniref:DUF1616 domain-containing protein n=1 Tax=Halorubrum lipolyticum DSM 21995 TaxID=1227482 RepID=M0NMB5_9EURY|nr:DUF1616 domain-containing protein [Halorubrum lipolyticum]EMA58931.1 hypothetical protein C469_12188 [Halorubrum lipolyticum DSM 21995]
MSSDDRGTTPLAGRLPLDLLVVSLVSLGVVALADAGNGGLVRTLLGGLFVVFCPGYALVAALLPQRTSPLPERVSAVGFRREESASLTGLERVVSSIAVSVILVPFVGFLLHYTQWGIRPTTMVPGIAAATVALSVLAAVRRLRLPPDERFAVASLALFRRLDGWVREPDRPVETALNVFLVVGLVVAVAGVGIAAATSTNGERYTELSVLGEDPETGEAVADEYPRALAPGEEATIRVGIANREGAAQTYTVVAQLQRLDDDGGGEARVVERSTLDRFEASLEPGESVERPRTVEPTMEGDGLRIAYLLYADDPPTNPTAENAYRSVHLWVDVGGSSATGTDASGTNATEAIVYK